MLSGLEIILDRMKSHPEEFVTFDGTITNGRWAHILNASKGWATEEEKRLIDDAYIEARRELVNQEALRTLAGEPSVVLSESPLYFNSKNRLQTFSNTTNEHIKLHKAELVKEIQRLKEEQEIKAMHEYYKSKGQAE